MFHRDVLVLGLGDDVEDDNKYNEYNNNHLHGDVLVPGLRDDVEEKLRQSTVDVDKLQFVGVVEADDGDGGRIDEVLDRLRSVLHEDGAGVAEAAKVGIDIRHPA